MVKYTIKKHAKSKKNNRTRKQMMTLKGGAWYSFFLPLLGYKDEKKEDETAKKGEKTDSNTTDKTDSNTTDKTDSNTTDPSVEAKPKKEKKGKKPAKGVRELYKVKSDPATIEKEFYDNPNITTWCFDDPGYKPVGIVHVTSVVGINILRSYATTVRNIVGVKGTIDENMHRLRNEIYNEMENVMEAKSIDKICAVGVAFTKDSGSLILSAFGTALRKKNE
jgi:uncharacterized protein YbjQ (UPF0145 family)